MLSRLVSLTLLLALTLPTPASALDAPERHALDLLNGVRARHGLRVLSPGNRLDRYAERHARRMASQRRLFHSALRISGYRALGEIVGEGGSVRRVHRAFLRSPEHRAILLGTWRKVGIGVARGGGRVWVVEIFAR